MRKTIKDFLMLACVMMLIPTYGAAQGNNSGNSFSKAKKVLLKQVYADHRITFYAKCKYNAKKRVDWSSCGLTPRKQPKRAARVEWEHVMPAWEFGHQLQCWHKSTYINRKGVEKKINARKNCIKTEPAFVRMESDMHNLRPAVGELNGDRSNYRYGMIQGENRAYGQRVDFEVNFKQRVAEPAPDVRGDIARTYYYMEKEYGVRIGKKQQRLFNVWNKQDPVDDWEAERNCRIARKQGNVNTFIKSSVNPHSLEQGCK